MTLPENGLFDIAVIGGGIQGAGVAQAASAAGYSTLLVERDSWAAATSRHSSKLVHGGLRYLESGQISLVYHSLRERRLLLRNAPELVKAVPFFIPVYRDTRRPPWLLRIGLSLYALLSGLTPLSRFRTLPPRVWGELDGLRRSDLRAVFSYWDAQTDDARLTRAVIASARELQALCLEHTELLNATRAGEFFELSLQTAQSDAADAGDWQCRARCIVNTAGPWVNEVAQRCGAPTRPLSWVKGSHIILPAVELPGIFYLEAPRDGRAVFLMPWRSKTLVGTTEVEIDGPDAQPGADEIQYLLETVRHYFPEFPQQVEHAFAGVRVLPAADADRPFNRARESILARHDRLVSIYGGKLTTYRQTAAQVIAQLRPLLGRREQRADTRSLALPAVDA